MKHVPSLDFTGKPQLEDFATNLCFYWAVVFRQTVGGELMAHSEKDSPIDFIIHGHAFVKYKGRYYDSRNPDSVEDIQDLYSHGLPDGKLRQFKTPDEFMESWMIDLKFRKRFYSVAKKLNKDSKFKSFVMSQYHEILSQ